jgi:hypothetical protein
MPEMEIGVVSRRTRFLRHADLWVRVIAYMMWPHDDDEGRRRAFVAYSFAALVKECETAKRPAELAPELFEVRKRGTLDILTREFHELAGGFAALTATGDGVQQGFRVREWSTVGFVLHFIRSMYAHGKPASVNKAAFMIANWERPDIADANVIRNQTEIKEAWRKYKAISHLAAAFIIYNNKVDPGPDIRYNIMYFMGFLAIAKSFQDFGNTFIPYPQKTPSPLLDSREIWSIPANLPLPYLPDHSVTLTLSELNIKTLRRYRAKK